MQFMKLIKQIIFLSLIVLVNSNEIYNDFLTNDSEHIQILKKEPLIPSSALNQTIQNDFFSFYSEEVEDNFTIDVRYPENYKQELNQTYPVIYLLDANFFINITRFFNEEEGFGSVVSRLTDSGQIPEVILVGIGYPKVNYRERDFLYPAFGWEEISGGGIRFSKFLENELIPYIDSNYRTNNSFGRTLYGHSYGGYYSLFSLLNFNHWGPAIFTNYIAASPAGYWAHHYLLDLEEEHQSQFYGGLPLKLYMTVGSKENRLSFDGYNPIRERFLNRSYSGFQFTTAIIPDAVHMATALPSFEEGLKWIFSTPIPGKEGNLGFRRIVAGTSIGIGLAIIIGISLAVYILKQKQKQ
ncbi:hypothetical protein WKT22_00044 [Candidatus Lokiarchaeum ossiferum]